MDGFNKEQILHAAKDWFKTIIHSHINNTKKLSDPGAFNINPFLVKYLAYFISGNTDPVSIAKALIYPRVLATSINTSFGSNLQKFISALKETVGGSTTSGIDIEFIDHMDGRKKYCQIKLGPNTINKDDVETIHRHFTKTRNLGRTNYLKLEANDLIIGVLYGTKEQLSSHYKNLENIHFYPVYIGQEFWERLTGSANFYTELIKSINEIAIEFDGPSFLDETIQNLAKNPTIIELANK